MSRNETGAAGAELLNAALHTITNLNDNVSQLTTGMKSRHGVRLVGAGALVYAGGPVLCREIGILAGVNFRETSGTGSVVVRILDGTDPAAGLLYTLALSPGAATSEWFPVDGGISFGIGLYVEVIPTGAGAVEGVIYRGAGEVRK